MINGIIKYKNIIFLNELNGYSIILVAIHEIIIIILIKKIKIKLLINKNLLD